ncbi:4-hydroxy-tetrahydrodipicolinate synthase [Bacillus sp. FSL W7-1360]
MKPTGMFGPVWTAMVTPFQPSGEIDFTACGELIDHLLKTGTDVLVVGGTTGESPVLSNEEKLALFSFCVKHVGGKAPVIAGTGSNDTKGTIALTKAAEKTGVQGAMLVTPYYNKPSQAGLQAHFTAVAEATTLPIMLYNVPGRTGVNMAAETTIALSAVPNIVAVKEASGDLAQIESIIKQVPDTFAVYSGDDGLTLPVLELGGDGIVSVVSHVIGDEMQALVRAFRTGRDEEAQQLQDNIVPVVEALFAAPNPTCVKYALNKQGVHVGEVKLPLVPANEQEQALVNQVLAHR